MIEELIAEEQEIQELSKRQAVSEEQKSQRLRQRQRDELIDELVSLLCSYTLWTRKTWPSSFDRNSGNGLIFKIIFTSPPAGSRHRHTVFMLSVRERECMRVCVRDEMLKVYKLLAGISPNLQLQCSRGKMNWLDFEVERSEVRVTVRPHVVIIGL